MVSKYLISDYEPQDFGNNWGLFIDIENEKNEKQINTLFTSLNYQVIIYNDIESQLYNIYYHYRNNKKKINLFNCLTTTIITSCLTYIVLCIL